MCALTAWASDSCRSFAQFILPDALPRTKDISQSLLDYRNYNTLLTIIQNGWGSVYYNARMSDQSQGSSTLMQIFLFLNSGLFETQKYVRSGRSNPILNHAIPIPDSTPRKSISRPLSLPMNVEYLTQVNYFMNGPFQPPTPTLIEQIQ